MPVPRQSTRLWRQLRTQRDAARYGFGTYRAASPRNTLAALEPRRTAFGITRLADVTGLDYLGVPVYQAIRPNSRNISVSQGKGLTRTQAKVSALMESVEGFHAEQPRAVACRASLAAMQACLGYPVDRLPCIADGEPPAPTRGPGSDDRAELGVPEKGAAELGTPGTGPFETGPLGTGPLGTGPSETDTPGAGWMHEGRTGADRAGKGGGRWDWFAPAVGFNGRLRAETVLEWVAATNLVDGSESFLPRQLCELDLTVDERLDVPLFRATSNGLASGNLLAEAVLHGLCELVERDARARLADGWSDPARRVDAATIDCRAARRLISRFESRGVRVAILDMTGPSGLPSFEVLLAEPGRLGYQGMGCHPRRDTALLRALTEAAQSRLAHIAGSRDDLYRSFYPQTLRAGQWEATLRTTARRDYLDIADIPFTCWVAMVDHVVAAIQRVTRLPVLVVDLTLPQVGIPVVQVVAPGLQIMAPERC